MSNDDVKRRRKATTDRERALKMLRESGMSDAEIEAELGFPIESSNDAVPAFTVDSEGIIDAEVVSEDELSKAEGIGGGERPAIHLPATIPAEPRESNEHNKRDWSKSSVPARRCCAHKKDGSQCKNAAILGSTVCRYHGGASKHVKAAARARLENAADRMAKELLGMAIDPDVSDSVKLAAIRDALDRSGLKAPNEVALSQGDSKPYDEIFDSIVAGPRDESRRARGYEDPIPNVVEPQDVTPHHALMDEPVPEYPAPQANSDAPCGPLAEPVADAPSPAGTAPIHPCVW